MSTGNLFRRMGFVNRADGLRSSRFLSGSDNLLQPQWRREKRPVLMTVIDIDETLLHRYVGKYKVGEEEVKVE